MEEKQCFQSESEKVTVSKLGSTKNRRMEGPDVGWAWVVALACCMINFIMAGLGRMSGILFVAFIEIFGVDRKSASMPSSVKSSARNLFGPVVGILGQKYGTRKVIIAGGIVGTLSASACFFTPDIMWITVLWGGVNGIGSALTVTLPQVVIGQYFDKQRTTASGIAFSGGCVGSFVFPALLEYLLHTFGIEGTFLIMGAIIMHTIPAALILRKPSWIKNGTAQKEVSAASNLNTTESLDNLVKEGNDVVVSKVKVSSINECTPQKSTPKNIRRESFKESEVITSIKRMSVRSINECTPKKGTPRSSVRSSEVYPNFKIMKENSEIVVKLLNIKDEDVSKISEVCQSEISIMDEIERMCISLRNSRGMSQFHKNIREVTGSIFSHDDKDVNILDQHRSFRSSRKLPSSKLPRVHSEPDISKLASEESKLFVLSKLSNLAQLDEQQIVSAVCGDKDKVIKVSVELLKLNKLCPRVNNNIEVIAKEQKELPEEGSNVVVEENSNSFSELIKTAFKLYINPLFVLVCLCRAVHFITFIPAMTTVVDFSMDKGLHEDDGKYVIAAISMGDLLGRLCLGWITDRGFMSLPKYMMVVMVLQGMSTASLPMMNTKVTIFSNLALFGMLQGSLFVRHPVLISKYMRTNEQSISMGCVNFFSGLLGFGLPVYIGYFRDTMQSYDYIFYINGAIGACVGLIWAFEPFFVRYVNAKRTTQKIVY